MIEKNITIALVMLAASLVLVPIFFSSVLASNGSLPKFTEEFTCGNGLPDQHCYKEGCMSERQLLMYHLKPDYQITFNAPRAGAYTCEVKLITNEFGFSCRNKDKPDCGAYCPQPNEKTDVYLNGEQLGTTEDLFCNTWDDCGTGNGNGDDLDCKGGEYRLTPLEIYTRCPEYYGYCGTPGSPNDRDCCHCKEFTVDGDKLYDGKWVRMRVCGGARCNSHTGVCKNNPGTIFIGTKKCSTQTDGLGVLPAASDIICKLTAHRPGSKCCDLSAYVGQTLWACACNTDRDTDEIDEDKGQHCVAISVCGEGSDFQTCP
jgi:hypothetical protein